MTQKIVMIRDTVGAANEQGFTSKTYVVDEVLPLDHPWQRDLAEVFISIGAAVEHKEVVLEVKDTPQNAQNARQKSVKKPKVGQTPPKSKTASLGGVMGKIRDKITG